MLAPRLPGLAVALAVAVVALLLDAAVPVMSPALVAVLLGAVVALVGVGERLAPGVQVAGRQVLRGGVALLGLQLVLGDVLALGWPVLLVVVAVVAGGIAGILLLARWFGIDRDAALLVACGFSICGAAAIAAVDGVRRARQETVATAVSLVVVFGSVAMVALPLAAGVLGLGEVQAGAWAGAAIQEVGQVVVAGGFVGGAALQVAVVVKLARVLCLAPVLAVVAWRDQARERAAEGTRPPLVPAFVVAFMLLVVVGSTFDLPPLLLEVAFDAQQVALAMGMFALGCTLSPRVMRATGRRVIALAAAATALVTLVGLPAAYVVG